ncbi:hypothetical protein HP567_006135 [Brevibacillus sp. M2.1A]|uniref:hypothetical protein n=1 Tax=Brevibacillus TaxID=55080 RepID=UPI00156B272A|nr:MULTISPECIES: hypothetical protein [Brevibacillus]MBY0083833.1 hypothetical protein [Brevibacillus brevis]MCC8434127.1 hypothetical protein [Brevibacillus sp. M2.1A]
MLSHPASAVYESPQRTVDSCASSAVQYQAVAARRDRPAHDSLGIQADCCKSQFIERVANKATGNI